MIFTLLVLVFSGFSNLQAANYSILFSEKRLSGWTLAGYAEWGSALADSPGLKIGDFQMYLDTVVGPNQYWDQVDGITNPKLLNGVKVTWTVDGMRYGGYIPSRDDFGGYPGLFEMPLSYDLMLSSIGNNPAVSWKNDFYNLSSGVLLTGYRVRVMEKGSSVFLCDYKLNSSNANMTAISQTFDFNSVPFDFAPDTDYLIRIEARKDADLYNRDGSILTVPGVDWAGITNRSIVLMDYRFSEPPSNVPIPSSLLLLGFGLAGLVGIKRR